MKLKAIILLLSGVLHSINTILFGDEERTEDDCHLAPRTLIYVALKTLGNAKTYEQVLDALGYFSEALDYVEDEKTNYIEDYGKQEYEVMELQEKNEKFETALNSNHKVVTSLQVDMKGMQSKLSETQVALAEERDKNNILMTKVDDLRSLIRQKDDVLRETRQVNEKLHNLVQGFEVARAEDL